MRHFLTILAALLLCSVPLRAQTLKSLMFNTTNGQVVANTGTNVLTFTNGAIISTPDDSIKVKISTEEFSVFTAAQDGNVLHIPADDTVQLNGGYWNDPTVRASLGFTTNLNTLWTATNASTARAAIGLGDTNDVDFGSVGISGGYRLDFSAGTVYDTTPENTTFSFGGTWYVPVSFSTNTVAATTRTNLGLPLAALTNDSNVTMIRALAGSTNTNQPFSGTFNVIDDNSTTYALVVSNGIILSVTEY